MRGTYDRDLGTYLLAFGCLEHSLVQDAFFLSAFSYTWA